MANHPPPAPSTVWTYAYQIVPPQPAHRLRALTALLNRKRTETQLGVPKWQARIVLEQHITHILVVSDSPELDIKTNRRLESELRSLQVGFVITAPLAVSEETMPQEVLRGV